MNTLNLIKLASIFLLSGVLASEYHKDAGIEKQIGMDRLIREGTVTLENVKAIFEENVADAPEVKLTSINFVGELEDPEVVKYVLSKCANMKKSHRAIDVRKILTEKISANYVGHLNLDQGSPEYEIVVALLESIKGHCYSGQDFLFPFDYNDLVFAGNVPLLEKFVEAGFKIPFDVYLNSINTNKLQTIKFLVKHGYNINAGARVLRDLVQSNEVSLDDFKYFVDHGLELECQFFRTNWLVTAFETGRIDLVWFICDKGIKLSKQDYMTDEGEKNVEKLVHDLAIGNAFVKYHLMFAGQKYGEEDLEYMPKELVLQIIKPIYEAERETILGKLYHA